MNTSAVALQVRLQGLDLQGLDRRTVCFDARVSNGAAVVGKVGDPHVTRDGADQSTPLQQRADGGKRADAGAVCAAGAETFDAAPLDLTIVATCDPSRDTSDAPGIQNDATLWLDGIYGFDGADDVRDPCPNGCTFAVDCAADTETTTTLDLLLMSDAFGGFSEYAMGLHDVVATAKTDCRDFLIGDDGANRPSAIAAMGMSHPSGHDFEVLSGPIAIRCDDQQLVFDPTVDGPGSLALGEREIHYATYQTLHTMQVVDKFNLALIFDLTDLAALGGSCRLHWSVTGIDPERHLLTDDRPSADVSILPFITFDAPLTSAGERACERGDVRSGTTLDTLYYSNAVRELAPLPTRCFRRVGDGPLEALHAPGCDAAP